ncbi:MAG: tRNA (adenosine(37)-N6)-threonylcarbamoyltransferase complex dimerization subunit type 1 TsaB [Candidatus Limnocylindrales bacterium]
MNQHDHFLAMDTATRTPTLALGHPDGQLVGERHWVSEHRHGEQLIERLDDLLADAGVDRRDLKAVVVGLGPGSFTGLRIGLATAKTLAYSLNVPIVGISTSEALALAAADGGARRNDVAVSLPAGAVDRYVQRISVDGDPVSVTALGEAQLAVPGDSFAAAVGDALLVAVDMAAADDISDESIERGQRAVAGLAQALVTIGNKVLVEGRSDDVARLVPAYVALPRGIAKAVAEMTWSPDLR